MDKPTPPTQTHAPITAPSHSRFAIGATVFAATLSSIASIFAITAYLDKSKAPAPTEQAATKSAPAITAVERNDGDLTKAGNHEKIKELFAKLTPEQRERWKSMTFEQRRDLRLKIEADLREAAKNKPQN